MTSTGSLQALLIAALLLAQLAPPVEAFHEELPTIASGSLAGNGWFSFKVETDGSPLTVERVIQSQGPFAWGTFVFDGEGRFLGGSASAWWRSYPEDGLLVHANAPDGQTLALVDTRAAPESAGTRVVGGVRFNDHCPGCERGIYKVLLWAAGQGLEQEWRVLSASGGVILGNETGPDAFFYATPEEFPGPSHAQVSATSVVARAGIPSVDVSVDDALFAWFGPNRTPACLMGACEDVPPTYVPVAKDPEGEVRRCDTPCVWTGAARGTYSFVAAGADVAVRETCRESIGCIPASSGLSGLLLAGADARLPS